MQEELRLTVSVLFKFLRKDIQVERIDMMNLFYLKCNFFITPRGRLLVSLC